LCGADPQHQHAGETPPAELAKSSEAERNKISVLLADLSQTTKKLEATVAGLESKAAALVEELAQSERRLQEELAPAAEVVTQDLSALLARRSDLEKLQNIAAEAAQLNARISKLSAAVLPTAPATSKGTRGVDLASHVVGVAQEIEDLLQRWTFPITGRVVFNSADHDFMFGSRKRASTGKGLRAVSYAAFSVALLRYCRGKNLPHPGLLVLDSPLVAYREKETPPGEEVPPDLKSNFYRDLASGGDNAQYVVLENEHPPQDLLSRIRWTRFTGAEGHGRYGLFPPKPQPGPTREEGPAS